MKISLARATSQPIIRGRHYVRMRSLSRSPISPSYRIIAASLLSSLLLAQPLFLPLVPSNRASLDIPTTPSPSAEPPPVASRLIALFFPPSSLSHSFPLSLRLLPSSLYLYFRPARERLARNPPQNKRASRRVAVATAQCASTLPCIFNYRLVTEYSTKLPANTVKKGTRLESARGNAAPETHISFFSIFLDLLSQLSRTWSCETRLRQKLNRAFHGVIVLGAIERNFYEFGETEASSTRTALSFARVEFN